MFSQAERDIYSQIVLSSAPRRRPPSPSVDGYLFMVNGNQLHHNSLPTNKRKVTKVYHERENLLCVLMQTDIL